MSTKSDNDQEAGTSSSFCNTISRDATWQQRLNTFTKSIVENFISKLKVYQSDAEPDKRKDNKTLNKYIKLGTGAAEKAAAFGGPLGGLAGKFVITGIEAIPLQNEGGHTNKAKKIVRILRKVKEDDLKHSLIDVAGEIFFSFQNQFNKITDNKNNDDLRGMIKLANDAVIRIFNFISSENQNEILEADLHHFFTKGVIFGNSKSEKWDISFKKPIKRFGHTLKEKGSGAQWYTTEIFENVFILKEFENNHSEQFIRSDKDEKDQKYGCRQAFEWEMNKNQFEFASFDSGKYKKVSNEISEISFNLTKEIIQDELKLIFKQIFPENKIDEVIKILHNSITLEDIKNLFDDIKEHQDSLTFKIIEEDKKNCFTEEKKERVWFNIKEPVQSFTGREKEITQIHESLQNKSNNNPVVIQAATISGFGGIGKTELSRMYIHRYKENYFNAIWIDSETPESLKTSFQKLAQQMEIETSPNTDMEIIVLKIYQHIGKSSSLIIFDNAESYDDIKDYLPPSLPNEYQKPFILLTSRHINWKAGDEGNIKIFDINIFTSN